MKLKKSSIIFLSILFIVLVFTIGVRYGQRVEKTNKIINYVISLPPSPSPQPTQKPLEFKTYSNKICGIQFIYPKSFDIKDSSQSAIFSDKKEKQIEVNCEKENDILGLLEDENIASGEVALKSKKTQTKILDKDQTYAFKFLNPKNAKTIFVAVKKSLYPLFEKSLEFLP